VTGNRHHPPARSSGRDLVVIEVRLLAGILVSRLLGGIPLNGREDFLDIGQIERLGADLASYPQPELGKRLVADIGPTCLLPNLPDAIPNALVRFGLRLDGPWAKRLLRSISARPLCRGRELPGSPLLVAQDGLGCHRSGISAVVSITAEEVAPPARSRAQAPGARLRVVLAGGLAARAGHLGRGRTGIAAAGRIVAASQELIPSVEPLDERARTLGAGKTLTDRAKVRHEEHRTGRLVFDAIRDSAVDKLLPAPSSGKPELGGVPGGRRHDTIGRRSLALAGCIAGKFSGRSPKGTQGHGEARGRPVDLPGLPPKGAAGFNMTREARGPEERGKS
jgi:hypothetical protein